ncbi:MAG: porin, partial [Shewanella sp.]|nr:porin [Shewanella sp.]
YNDGISSVESYRVLGQVKVADFKIGGLFQNTESQKFSNMEGNSYIVNLAYNLNGINLKAEYGMDEAGMGKYFKNAGVVGADTTDVNVENIIVGADYRLSKSTLLWGHFAHYSGDYKLNNAKVDLSDDNVFTVGVRYDF